LTPWVEDTNNSSNSSPNVYPRPPQK